VRFDQNARKAKLKSKLIGYKIDCEIGIFDIFLSFWNQSYEVGIDSVEKVKNKS
jgi:hypothetical protein